MHKVKFQKLQTVTEKVFLLTLSVNVPSLEATTNTGSYSQSRNIQYLIFIHTYKGAVIKGLFLLFPQIAKMRPHHIRYYIL